MTMSDPSVPDIDLAYLRDPRLSHLVTSRAPAWLWAADASRILWANAAAAALLGAPTPAALTGQAASLHRLFAAAVARLAQVLPDTGTPRLERLAGIGGGIARTVVCSCARMAMRDGILAIMVTAAEPIGPALPLAERVRRTFADSHHPLAVFSALGECLHATDRASEQLTNIRTLADLDASTIAAAALRVGQATGASAIGPITIDRMGAGSTTVLVVTLPRLAVADLSEANGASASAPATGGESAAGRERYWVSRFVWQIDAAGRFTIDSGDFTTAVGPSTAGLMGRPWREVAARLGLDPEMRVEEAVASRQTWSGIIVAWPVDGTDQRLTIELSGLPMLDRQRGYLGYRGFGVCRSGNRPTSIPGGSHDVAARKRLTNGHANGASEPTPGSAGTGRDRCRPTTGPAVERGDARPLLTVVPAVKNVVPFRTTAPAGDRRSILTPVDRSAPPRSVGKSLAPRGNGSVEAGSKPTRRSRQGPQFEVDRRQPPAPHQETPHRASATAPPGGNIDPHLLDHFPVGVIVYGSEGLRFANRALLDWTGYDDLDMVMAAGGLDRLFVTRGTAALDALSSAGSGLTMATRQGGTFAVEARLFMVPWEGESACMLVIARTAPEDRHKASALALRAMETENHELRSMLDTATDGVIVVARDGRIASVNRSAEALFGYEAHELTGRPLTEIFAPESHRAALDYLDGLTRNGVASVLNDGREVIGRVRQGGLIPLFMTMGRIADGTDKFCAVFRDITQWKRAEEELLNSKRMAERASSAKSDFLAKISHEIRTPLNAIIGFSEVMMEERFGAVGNDRYRQYLKDIHASGEHLISLVNDLLDLSKIEAGKLDLSFTSVNLNELVLQCVALMQPQANRERIIIRTSLLPTLPPIVVDARSIRQIVLNLLSNSIKFTAAGGQVIVSTALTPRGEAVLRVRDTGVGMTEKEIETALEPFRQLATSGRWGSGGTGLGLPLTKALAEANRATFSITSAINAGTLVEITFPATRVLAE